MSEETLKECCLVQSTGITKLPRAELALLNRPRDSQAGLSPFPLIIGASKHLIMTAIANIYYHYIFYFDCSKT